LKDLNEESGPSVTQPEQLLHPDNVPDNVNMKRVYGSSTETSARQLGARLALYNLSVIQFPQGYPGNCLFKAILHTIPHPSSYTVHHLRMAVVWYLVKHAGLVHRRLGPSLVAKDISFYTLCKRLLLPHEWGGLETLLFLRWNWKIAVTVISPGHDNQLFHNFSVPNSALLLAYNGSNHYSAVSMYFFYFCI
jgi:hypothetical protein